MEVKPLYTHIPRHEGIEAVKETLNTESNKPIATKSYNQIFLLNNYSLIISFSTKSVLSKLKVA